MSNILRLLATAALLIGTAAAADHPDLSGTWKIDPSKSDMGSADLSGLSFAVRLEGSEMFVKQTLPGQDDIELHFNTAGEERTNQIGAMKMISKHRWQGDIFTGEYQIAGDYGEATQIDKMTFNADGKQFTLDRVIKGDQGEKHMKLVFNKQ